jgi:hypothetical protein
MPVLKLSLSGHFVRLHALVWCVGRFFVTAEKKTIEFGDVNSVNQ